MSEKIFDLRTWLDAISEAGSLTAVNNAHWDGEIGAITDLARQKYGNDCPTLVFDNIVGYPAGWRVVSNPIQSLSSMAVTLDLPLGLSRREYVDELGRKLRDITPLPALEVEAGPVLENQQHGDEVDLLSFPTPKWHEADGGRYIGTGDVVITQAPGDDSWTNLGTYRVSIHDRNHLFVYISPGKHGRLHRDAFLEHGAECPVAISFGHDPALWIVASQSLPYGVSEFDQAGGLRGVAVEVIRGSVTGLPFPAHSEIVIEGFITQATAMEGPFGEWTGYYASGEQEEYLLRVEAVYHRNAPIILGDPPGRPPHAIAAYNTLVRSGIIREQLVAAGVPGVTGVCVHEIGGSRFFVAVSIDQKYPGHPQQAAMATAASGGGAYMGKYILIVDDDIDVFDLDDVLWALFTRTDPATSMTFIERCWSGPLEPSVPPEQKGHSSRVLIDACRPWEWKESFPRTFDVSDELRDQVVDKFSSAIDLT